jgi:hypothetical protein
MPDMRPSVKSEQQCEALKDKGRSKERAARIANSPQASSTAARSRTPAAAAPRRAARPRRRRPPPQGRARDGAEALVSVSPREDRTTIARLPAGAYVGEASGVRRAAWGNVPSTRRASNPPSAQSPAAATQTPLGETASM